MKGAVKLLNHRGHTLCEYDTADQDTVNEAERIVREALANSAMLFDGTTREQIKADRVKLGEREEVLVVPPMAGGAA